MKRTFSLILSVLMLFSLVACGENGKINTDISGNVSQTDTTNLQVGDADTTGTNSNTQVVVTTDNSEATNITNTENNEQSSNGEQHTHTYTVAKYSPSCETDGFTKYSCSCGDQYTEDTIPAKGHSYNDWEQKVAPTETSVGKEERKCKNCDKTESRELPKLIPGHTHRYTSSVTKEATCQTEGVKTFSCSCGAKYVETIAVKSHTYNKTGVVQPTCTTQGYTTYSCSCGNSYAANYTSPSHTYADYVCTVCGYTTIPQGYTAIYKPEHLNNLNLDGKYILMCDIDMIQTNWTSIGTISQPFTGIFDGNGYCVKNIRISSSGFFDVNEGEIKNLGLENLTIISNGDVGGLVRKNQGTISKCYVTGKITTTSYICRAGGLVGENIGTISNCYALCDVTATATENSLCAVGGLVGFSSGEINNCYASGKIKGTSEKWVANVGCLVGETSSVITNCFATGTVSSSAKEYSRSGGIIGVGNWKGTNCWYGGIKFTVKKGSSYTYEPTNVYGAEINVETLKTVKFQKETLGWSSDIWNFVEGQYPTLKKP